METLTLAFDIERTGATTEYDTIGIWASVVDADLKELDRLFLPGYMGKEDTKFEKRCWDEFWSKNEDKLALLQYEGDSDREERQKEMITEFQEFRRKWEKIADEKKLKLELVSDNNVYDGRFINDMIEKHRPEDMPIPYNAGDRKHSSFWETHSMQKGLLAIVDPQYNENWNFFQRIGELYTLPEMVIPLDHKLANNARSIASEHQVCLGIKAKKFKRIVKRRKRGKRKKFI